MTQKSGSGIRTHVAAVLRAALDRDGRTSTTLARQVGLSRSSLSAKLHARSPIYVDELVAIKTALGLDVLDLLPVKGSQGPGGGGGLDATITRDGSRRALGSRGDARDWARLPWAFRCGGPHVGARPWGALAVPGSFGCCRRLKAHVGPALQAPCLCAPPGLPPGRLVRRTRPGLYLSLGRPGGGHRYALLPRETPGAVKTRGGGIHVCASTKSW